MTPAFGFSIGDFISAIELIRKISKALSRTGGASFEFQHVIIELEGLERALAHLKSLAPSQDNAGNINAIRGMALACQFPLKQFLEKLERYEQSLGPFATGKAFSRAGRKAKWALYMTEEVTKFRSLIAAKVMSINLLLATQCAETLSKIDSRGRAEHSDLLSKIGEQRTRTSEVSKRLEEVREEVTRSCAASDEFASKQIGQVKELQAKVDILDGNTTSSIKQIDSLFCSAKSVHSSMISLKNIGEQIVQFIATFPAEIRDLLRRTIHTNLQLYHLLLHSQSNVSQPPTLLLQSNIRFEDALGRSRELPYEWFRNWETFEGFLQAEFKDFPGESKVHDGQYHIIDAQKQGRLIKKEAWARSVFPGSAIYMLMIISHLRVQGRECPRPSCKSTRITSDGYSPVLTCQECRLIYHPSSTSLEDQLQRFTVLGDDEEVTQRQIKEDLQLYGSKPKPLDPDENSEATIDPIYLDNQQQTHRIAISDVQSERLGDISKSEPPAMTNAQLTSIDWNNGTSLFDAWLNQSALPSAAIPLEKEHRETENRNQELKNREMQEIEYFRKIQISTSSDKSQADAQQDSMDMDGNDQIEFGARIYYRNILDRYPRIPQYLARRLAEANLRRAERLRQLTRVGNESIYKTSVNSRTEGKVVEDKFLGITQKTREHHEQLASNPNPNAHPSETSFDTNIKGSEQAREILPLAALPQPSTSYPESKEGQSKGGGFFDTAPPQRSTEAEESLRNWLQAKSEECKKWQEEERARLETLKMNQRRLEQTVLQTLLREFGGVPLIFDGMGGDNLPVASLELAQRHVAQLQTQQQIQQQQAQQQQQRQQIQPSPDHQRNNRNIQLLQLMIQAASGQLSSQFTSPASQPPSPWTLPPPSQYAQWLQQQPLSKLNTTEMQIQQPSAHGQTLHPLQAQSAQQEMQQHPPSPPSIYFHDSVLSTKNRVGRLDSDFWSGSSRGHDNSSPNLRKNQRRRSSSVHTRSSTTNSSLRGPRPRKRKKSSPVNTSFSLALPPPPVELGGPSPFDCDICGMSVRVKKRNEWKKHVFADLQPYCCTFPGCPKAKETYKTRRAFITHEVEEHRDIRTFYCSFEGCNQTFKKKSSVKEHFSSHFASKYDQNRWMKMNRYRSYKWLEAKIEGVTCPLCKEQVEPEVVTLGRHVGRHMEEISFAVVTRPYGDWKFYTDTSSAKSSAASVSL